MTEFPVNLYGAAFIGALLSAWVSVPGWRYFCRCMGLVDDPGHRKIHRQAMPLAGGLSVITGILTPLIVGWLALQWFGFGSGAGPSMEYGVERRGLQMGVILFGAVGMLVLGGLDDRLELKPATKFIGQFLTAGTVAAAGLRITLFVPNLLFSYGVTILWILTVTNALNFMDNMNGLCTGLGVICSTMFAIASAKYGQYLVATTAFLAGGALLGFLPHNYPKASAFLGDAGSHLVGYWLAVLAILPHFYSAVQPSPWAVLSPLLILFVPLADLIWVVGMRWRQGQPFYVGDTNHLSHRLVRRGFSTSMAVALIWLMAALTGSLSFLLH